MTRSYFMPGARIKELRTKLGLQQKDILRILKEEYGLELSSARYSNYESDNRQMPAEILKLVAEILNTDTNELLGVTIKELGFTTPIVDSPIMLTNNDSLVAVKLKKKYPIFSYLLNTGNSIESVKEEPISVVISTPNDLLISLTEKDISNLDKSIRKLVEYELFKLSQK